MSEIKTLSTPAQKTINDYLHLPFPGHDVACPYFNNRRANIRGGLRALIGKGNVADIVEEATIISLREKINLKTLTDEQLKKFLIDNHLGVDCSGFVYHVLDKELNTRGLGPIRKHLHFPFVKNPLRKLLTLLRPAEHAGARTLWHPSNSQEISLKDIQPGDLIIMLDAGEKHNRNHVILIHKVEYENDIPKILYYSHSFAWSSDGAYNHGVRQGQIDITQPDKGILEQSWKEQGKTAKENETYLHAGTALSITIRRLQILVSR